jgi:nucleoid-associated protein YgaU
VQVAAQVSGEPATRTKPVIVVVPVVVAPAAPAPTPTAEPTPEPTPEPTVEPTAEPESTADAAESTAGQAYVVQPGDTLTALAQEYLGSETRYKEIVAATNEMAKQDPAYKQITDPNMIVVGQQIWIPAR